MQFIVYSSIILMMEFWILYIGLPKYFNHREFEKKVKDFEKNFLFDTEKTLYIIGNGFDLHHGIKSKYTDFKSYLYSNNKKAHDLFEKYCQYDSNKLQKELNENEKIYTLKEWQDKRIKIINELREKILWNNWENSLGRVKLSHDDEFFEWGMDWPDDSNEKRLMDLEHSRNYRDEVQKLTELLKIELKREFRDWIIQIEIPLKKIVEFKSDSLFLNFNYTRTLELIYNIKPESINYIHGNVSCPDDLIFGHRNDDFHKLASLGFLGTLLGDSDYKEFDEAQKYYHQYLKDTYKNVDKIIRKNESFFEDINNFGRIIVIGHSLSLIDIDYFKCIVKNASKYTKWIVTYYEEKDKSCHLKKLTGINIPSKNIYLVKIENLKDWKLYLSNHNINEKVNTTNDNRPIELLKSWLLRSLNK